MIGLPTEQTLATACEHRIGREIRVASTLHLHRVRSPEGHVKPRKREAIVIALTESDFWFLEYRYWVIGFTVGGVLTRWPRHGVVAHWRHRWWAWPSVWRLELSYPRGPFYVEGDLMGGGDADAMIGLMACDDLERAGVPTSPVARDSW